MSEPGKIVGDALERVRKQQESAQKTAQEIDAQRERERAGGVAMSSPTQTATPSESK